LIYVLGDRPIVPKGSKERDQLRGEIANELGFPNNSEAEQGQGLDDATGVATAWLIRQNGAEGPETRQGH
jgi:hypothetical protein